MSFAQWIGVLTLLFQSTWLTSLIFPSDSRGNTCQLGPKLASVMVAYRTEELLTALTWKAAREKFGASYLQKNNNEEAKRCLAPAVYAAVDNGDLIVVVSMYNDNDDEEEKRNANELAHKSLMGVAESTQRMIQNLRSSSDRSVSVFVLSSDEVEKTFDNHLCGAIADCKVNYLVQGPLKAFATMCRSDLLVMTAHGEMMIYAAALCSNHEVLAPSSLSYMNLLINEIKADRLEETKVIVDQGGQVQDIIDEGVVDNIYSEEWMLSRVDNFTMEALGAKVAKAIRADRDIPRSFFLATCRGNQKFAADIEAGEENCQFGEVPMVLQNMRNDFDLLRWATDYCEKEFHDGNKHSRLMFNSYRTAVACVTMLKGKVMDLIKYHLNDVDEMKEETMYDVRAEDQYSDTLEYQNKHNVKCEINWMFNLTNFEQRIRSQGGQDGVLKRIFEIIGTSNQYYVELGFNSPTFTTGSNSFHLHDQGWKGLILDNNHENPDINLQREFVTIWNVVPILEKYQVPYDVDYISIDIDSQDIWILKAIIGDPDSKYRPRVISIEYNGHFPLAATVSLPPSQSPDDPGIGWDGFDIIYGASAGAIKIIANMYGYEVVHMVQYFDMFLVRRDLLEGACPPPLASFIKKAKPFHYCVASPTRKNMLIDVQTYLKYGDVKISKVAAQEQLMLLYNPSSEYSSSPDCAGFDVMYSQHVG